MSNYLGYAAVILSSVGSTGAAITWIRGAYIVPANRRTTNGDTMRKVIAKVLYKFGVRPVWSINKVTNSRAVGYGEFDARGDGEFKYPLNANKIDKHRIRR